jgi:hypothetical protein
MDEAAVRNAIRAVIRTHKQVFAYIGTSQTKLLELGAISAFAEHYKANGFSVKAIHPKGKSYFAVKTSTRGDPWNFSRFTATKNNKTIELHMNVLVRSAHDRGIYCVDVGVVKDHAIPAEKPKKKWRCLKNSDLVTFGEAKKLVVYPMLLAQFIGIVHEIKPWFLGCGVRKRPHPAPVLIALGHFSGNSGQIVSSYPSRNIAVTIAENFDIRLSRVRGGSAKSAFG